MVLPGVATMTLSRSYHPAFREAAYRELAQGSYKDNESIAFVDIPDHLMAESQWAFDAGWEAAMHQSNVPEQVEKRYPGLHDIEQLMGKGK